GHAHSRSTAVKRRERTSPRRAALAHVHPGRPDRPGDLDTKVDRRCAGPALDRGRAPTPPEVATDVQRRVITVWAGVGQFTGDCQFLGEETGGRHLRGTARGGGL